jgi:glycosyltransferase involved in cell wall biosynthesis
MMPKMWKKAERPTALFKTTHRDRTGGGELYAHQIAAEFANQTDLRYYIGDGGGLHPDFSKYHDFDTDFLFTGSDYVPDVFIGCSHFSPPAPIGRHRNIFITFFPNPAHREEVKGYDTIITCSNFSARWVQTYWRKKATVIYPYIDSDEYEIKSDDPYMILNVGRFFHEPHGHSKKQHVLIEALSLLHRTHTDFHLALAGSVLSPSDSDYVRYCEDVARTLGVGGSVKFYGNADRKVLKGLYEKARFYWHANGYGSDTPYETEHFGIVIAEAMAAGCVPIIFRGGGYEDFGCDVWETPRQLAIRQNQVAKKWGTVGNYLPHSLKAAANVRYSQFNMRRQVEALVKR